MNSRTVFAIIFSALFSLFGIVATSGASKSAQDSGSTAKSLVRLLEEHYRHPQTLRAVFLERYSEGQKQARVESGNVYFRRPGQMRWEYDSPEKKLFLVDGKTSWFYVPYDHTVTKSPAKESSDWRTPLALLTGKADLSRMCGRIDLVSQSGIPSGHSVLRCRPREPKGASEDKEITEVFLEIDSSSGELARIEVRQPGGIELEFRFGNWQTNVTLPDEMFRFQVPVGVAVVDGAISSEGPR